MSRAIRIILGAIGTVVVIGGGIAAGIYLSQKSPPAVTTAQESPAPVTATAPSSPATPAPVSQQPAPVTAPGASAYEPGYTVSPPSRGPYLHTIPIKIDAIGDMAFVFFPEEDAKDIKAGQNVMLYDIDGQPLEALGKVFSVDPSKGEMAGKVAVRIKLLPQKNAPLEKMISGKIVTGRETMAQRLPLGALQTDADGRTYLWEVLINEDGTKAAQKKYIAVLEKTPEFFIIDIPTGPGSNIFILNPDDKVQDGQMIAARQELYTAPPSANDLAIQSAIDEKNRKMVNGKPYDPAVEYGISADDYTCADERAAMADGTAAPTGATGGSCTR